MKRIRFILREMGNIIAADWTPWALCALICAAAIVLSAIN